MDTTAHLITALMYFLSANHNIYTKLLQEIDNFDLDIKSVKLTDI